MATKKKTTALTTWDEELAKQAAIAAGMEESTGGGGQFFSVKGGVLTWQDAPLPNNQMAVIILDSILENVYYEGQYDPDEPSGPVCYALGRVEKTLEPHKLVVEAGTAQHDQCEGCEMNEFGSARVGRGKACRNTRRLAMIPAGTFDKDGKLTLIDDVDHYTTAVEGYMRLSVMSVKGYASFVKQVAGTLKRPPFGIITKVKVVPDPKSQFRITFEPLMNVPDEFMSAVVQRHQTVAETIGFPYPMDDEPIAKKPAKKPARKTRKY